MSRAKTRIDTRVAQRFLHQKFDPAAGGVEKIGGGELAEAFFFEAGGVECVLRIHSQSNGFIKDKYAFEHFRSREIRIPQIVQYGRFDDGHFYAVSERAPGVTQDALSVADRRAAIPSVLRALDAIHATDISDSRGYGYWRGSGHARRKSPDTHIRAMSAGGPVQPYVDQAFHRALREKMRPLFEHLPAQRFLVHGDFGHNNLVIDDVEVSAVLDWAEGAYGDFMQDVAWLDFWDTHIDYGSVVREHYENTGKEILHYHQRLRLHKLAIASGSLGFVAWSRQEPEYREHLAWIKSLELV